MQREVYRSELPYALAVHGGAGPLRDDDGRDAPLFRAGLSAALDIGRKILADGGAATDAVVAAVAELEDRELFNAGRGAALTEDGIAQLDACLVDGSTGFSGSVLGSRFARNPIKAAEAVLRHTQHAMLVDPQPDVLEGWGVDVEMPEYFITERRRMQLAGRLEADPSTIGFNARGHGTVGAVARDTQGNMAAATSTGGVTGQATGRVGDSPIPGAGTYADNATVAISCTGIGEFFVRGVVGYDVAARLKYGHEDLPDAVSDALTGSIEEPGGAGGIIALDSGGQIVFGYNTPTMLRGYVGPDGNAIVAGA